MSARTAYRGTLVDFTDDPRVSAGALRVIDDGLLVVNDGKVESAGPAAAALAALPPGTPVVDHGGSLIMPGFIDAHVHYPQTDVIASHGKQLLDWLTDYTFPTESSFGDAAHAATVAEFFLDELERNGTTTAAIYATIHPESVDAIFAAAQKRNMRVIAGKVMMDVNAPDSLRDEAEQSYADSKMLIERWHGKDRLLYGITPRFAATSTERQLELAGKLMDEHAGMHMQTHLAENHAEVKWIAELFPWSKSYLGVYEKFGLVRPGSLYGHSIHLSADDWRTLGENGAAVIHCPTSNLFLGSGLFDLDAANASGTLAGLATDVGGGTSFSMLRTMHEAYKVAQLARRPFTSLDGFYLATLGGARSLGLADKLGNFEAGKEADFIVLDPKATPLIERRYGIAQDMTQKLFVLMMLGDDRLVARTYILGEPARLSA
ncbi:MAG: guanine deaminase [Betaproteobacteria bacterium]|nr:guanine deaminase [Betaproteobacteria bacterium]